MIADNSHDCHSIPTMSSNIKIIEELKTRCDRSPPKWGSNNTPMLDLFRKYPRPEVYSLWFRQTNKPKNIKGNHSTTKYFSRRNGNSTNHRIRRKR